MSTLSACLPDVGSGGRGREEDVCGEDPKFAAVWETIAKLKERQGGLAEGCRKASD